MSQIQKLLDEKCHVLFSLKDRWADEKEYEDFEEYKDVIYKIFLSFGFIDTVLFKSFRITTNYQGQEITVKILKNGVIQTIC